MAAFFIGTFAGTGILNIILEFRIGPGQNPDGRFVGQVMLPSKVTVKVEAHIAEERHRHGTSRSAMDYRLSARAFPVMQIEATPPLCARIIASRPKDSSGGLLVRGQQHKIYAHSASGPKRLLHHLAAYYHKKKAAGHQKKVKFHRLEAALHRSGGRDVTQIEGSIDQAKESLREGHEVVRNQLFGQTAEQAKLASTNANHAVDYLLAGMHPMPPNMHNAITGSAARNSNVILRIKYALFPKKMADVTLHWQNLPH
ncbi:hypothetical protein M413DRAFT_12431 [Hebeloma cylindrosporum]|uniref:Uncharacterized protein n=1 Tax=Hebeloma cylindrosporum TaxID=76867 RepID=A0A0C3C4H8_HEBCY|nr:hypothetical protein M413DRAFT_12431 [Hebeloma cylindrosporum h7]